MIARRIDLAAITRTAVSLTVALAILGRILGLGDLASLVFGAGLAVANLHLIRMVVSRLVTPDAAGQRTAPVVATKFLLLLTLVALSLKGLPVDGASFLVGVSTLFVAIVLQGLVLGQPLEEDERSGT
jgi:hypothetical protein